MRIIAGRSRRISSSNGRFGNGTAFSSDGAGAARVRSPARSLAERERGFAAISASSATTGFFVSVVKGHAGTPTVSGWWREPARVPAALRAKNVLTIRSSSEWKDTTTSRPPGLSTRSAAGTARQRQFTEFVVDAQPQLLKRARRGMNFAGLATHDARHNVRQAARVIVIGLLRFAP